MSTGNLLPRRVRSAFAFHEQDRTSQTWPQMSLWASMSFWSLALGCSQNFWATSSRPSRIQTGTAGPGRSVTQKQMKGVRSSFESSSDDSSGLVVNEDLTPFTLGVDLFRGTLQPTRTWPERKRAWWHPPQTSRTRVDPSSRSWRPATEREDADPRRIDRPEHGSLPGESGSKALPSARISLRSPDECARWLRCRGRHWVRDPKEILWCNYRRKGSNLGHPGAAR